MPQGTVADALGVASIKVSDAIARDSGSIWLLNPRPFSIGGVLIASPEEAVPPTAIRLMDSAAFGTGHHPTTALCIEALERILSSQRYNSMLDVGTGSGILAITALMMGVPQAVGLDIDSDALKAALENARLNHVVDRLQFVLGGPDVVDGTWPLVVANVLAGPLIEMAPHLVRRVASGGCLVLSGISWTLESEVRQAYRHFGMRHISSQTHAGWSVLMEQASW